MKSSEKNKNQFSLLLNQKISFNGTTKYQIKKKVHCVSNIIQ